MRLLTFDAPGALPDAFLDLPQAAYGRDPWWIPEDRDATIRAVAREHDWFETGTAAGFCIAGHARLAVFRPASLSVNGRQAAIFGYWEHACGSDATALLLDEAEAWARAAGAEVLYGPIDFNT